MAEKRKQNIEQKKLQKKLEASKLLLEHRQLHCREAEASEIITTPPPTQKKQKQPSPPPSDEDESDSSVEKVIVNVKNKKKKKKAKEIIIYNDDSSDESEDERPSGTTFGRPELVAEQRSREGDVLYLFNHSLYPFGLTSFAIFCNP